MLMPALCTDCAVNVPTPVTPIVPLNVVLPKVGVLAAFTDWSNQSASVGLPLNVMVRAASPGTKVRLRSAGQKTLPSLFWLQPYFRTRSARLKMYRIFSMFGIF